MMKFVSRTIETKAFQERVDLHRIWKLVVRNEYSDTKFTEMHWWKQPSDAKKIEECQREIIPQIIRNFTLLKDIDRVMPSSFEIFREVMKKDYSFDCEVDKWSSEFLASKSDMNDNLFDDMKTDVVKEIQQKKPSPELIQLQNIERQRSERVGQEIKKSLGWIPEVRVSTAGDAGNGLFLSGSCKKGTVLGLYPGMIYAGEKMIFGAASNQYTYNMLNSFVINGDLPSDLHFSTLYNRSVDRKEESVGWMQKLLEGEEYYIFRNKYLAHRFIHPFANLQFVNHPPHSLLDNVLPYEMRIPLNFDPTLLPYVPNQYFIRPTIESKGFGMIRIVVFIARRDLKDEEVFVNYRLDPASNLPEWYHSLNIDEDKRIWSKN